MPLRTSDLERDALGLAKLVRQGDVLPLELVDAAITAVERTHDDLNAVNVRMFEFARKEARTIHPRGPFGGVPFLLKDIRASYAGVPTSDGTALLRHVRAEHNSEIVKRHKKAGLICIGKTNTPELGLTATTEPHAFGPTHNPWDTQRTPGGSSGGAAAAVAARIVPMAHASDGGGSIRIPASCCGLVGLKPTRARNPLGPDAGDVMNGFVVEHSVSLTVRDCAALLDATSGPDLGDPYWAPPPARPFLDEVGADPGRLRIAVATQSPMQTPVHADCVGAVVETAKLLEDLGHRVEEAVPEYDDYVFREAFTAIWFANLAATLGRHTQLLGREVSESEYEPFTCLHAARGTQTRAVEYVGAVAIMQAVARRIAPFFERYDLWMTPTLASPAPRLGFLHPMPEETELRTYARRVKEFAPFTQLANATGQPAMSLPLHWNASGLPIGVHFTARFGDEASLFRLAAQLEQARPWIGRKPPICAL